MEGHSEVSGTEPGDNPVSLDTIDAAAQTAAERLVLTAFAPPWVLVDAELHVLHSSGALGEWLDPSRGGPDLLRSARFGVRAELAGLFDNLRSGAATVASVNVAPSNAGVQTRIEVHRVPDSASTAGDKASRPAFLVAFIAAHRQITPARGMIAGNQADGEENPAAREFAESLLQSIQTPLLVLDQGLRVLMANQIFLKVYSLRLSEIEGQPLAAVGRNQWNSPELTDALRRVARGEADSEDLEVEQELAGNLPDSRRIVMIHARRIARSTTREFGAAEEFPILLTTADITAQRRGERIMLDERERLRKSVHESEEALRGNREELHALAASLLHAQDEERRRVSRELHDDVSQHIAKLQFDIETLEQNLRPDLSEEKKRLVEIAEGFGQLSNDLRRIAYGLHPSTLDHLGLAVALRGFCREFSRRTRIHVRFTAGGLPARFPPDVASAFYRITQEALRNIAKHAPASDIKIRLTGGDNQAKLTIRDNGPGFDREAVRAKGGLGLISMQERSRLIHAAFDITTEPGGGATITVIAPLE